MIERKGIPLSVVYNLNLQFCMYIRLIYVFSLLVTKLVTSDFYNLEILCHSVFCLHFCMNVTGMHLSKVKEKLALKYSYGISVPPVGPAF